MKQEYVAAVKARDRYYFPIPDSVAKMLNVRDADLFKPMVTPDGKVQFERVSEESEKG